MILCEPRYVFIRTLGAVLCPEGEKDFSGEPRVLSGCSGSS